ncbi:organ-specific protein P4-like [Tripterygium wilfordii]|uniref:Organ-specific protein P4-like n=2 Tax=Tripterygium wilfordii TaxID=458696 RepID=A0A7J7DYG0_TRIWF|nr:organ-specific protein P4-like [Tripterygium wilfordii]
MAARLSNGRKEPEEYWKRTMKDQPMPEQIKNLLFHQDPTPLSDKESKFVKDFDFGANAIIYHSRDHHKPERGLQAEAEMREGGDGYQITRKNIK